MRKEREYTWYIQPKDGDTNQALSRILRPENYQAQLPDGGPENVWECKYPTVNAFLLGKVRQGYCFAVFVKEGNGQVRPAESFLPLRKMAKPFVPTKARSRQAVS